MSEPTISILISAIILFVLALFVPCMESLAKLLRGGYAQACGRFRKAIATDLEAQGRVRTA